MQGHITNVADFKRADFNKVREKLGRIPWMELPEGKNKRKTLENEIIKS